MSRALLRTEAIRQGSHGTHRAFVDEHGDGYTSWAWSGPFPHRHTIDWWRVVPAGPRWPGWLRRLFRHTHELGPLADG